MIPVNVTSAMANHLWQSTLFAAVAALLALALHNNHARTRYWIWLSASVKFLVPFSLLSAVGGQIGSLTGWLSASRAARTDLAAVVKQVGQPFPQQPLVAAMATAIVPRHTHLLPAILFAVWACGCLAVALIWWRRWRRVRAAMCAGSPLEIGAGIPVLSSPALLEPGVFGIFRPVLLLPEGITDHLAPAHLKAILAHELCHVRRRDNLMAAIHMLVEAMFWFHPLVWWVGARLVEERERACDEEVVRLGGQPEIYAESILKTCQFYLESPLACMSGIAGSDLKKRIVRIMTGRVSNSLSFGRKLLLIAAGTIAIAGPIVIGLTNPPPSRAQSAPAAGTPHVTFDVTSIKPERGGMQFFRIGMDAGRFTATNATLKTLIQIAYRVKDSQISGAPGWTESEHYNIEAKLDDPPADPQRKGSPDDQNVQLLLMLQSMLADRFKLAIHHETKDLPIYALVVAKNGPKMHESPATPDDDAPNREITPNDPPPPHTIRMNGRGELNVNGENMDMFADLLSRQLGLLIVNKTGLKSNYDFTLKWTPDEGHGLMPGNPPGDAAPPAEASGPSIYTALQEQLGLKLESQKGPVDTIVIDRVEKPSAN
jgi:uncharacterized protein (TIGR03435 family)